LWRVQFRPRRKRRGRNGARPGAVCRCFEKALGLGPDLAVARWGIAYSVGPNYNKAWDAFDPVELAASLARARDELRLAAHGHATAIERGLIEALAARFRAVDVTDTAALAAGSASAGGHLPLTRVQGPLWRWMSSCSPAEAFTSADGGHCVARLPDPKVCWAQSANDVHATSGLALCRAGMSTR
jgi:hypothetical protein